MTAAPATHPRGSLAAAVGDASMKSCDVFLVGLPPSERNHEH